MRLDPNSLIGTQHPAPMQVRMLLESRQSEDYANLEPYPSHAFGEAQWPAQKGPLPTPLPYCGALVSEGAGFVFRNGVPKFSVADDDLADALLQTVITQNHLPEQYVALAEHAGHQGAIAAFFAYDAGDELCPIRLSFLSIPQEARIWVDPHNLSRVLMARIQYPYRDVDGQWYYHREEWTDDLHVTYNPKFAGKADILSMYALPGYAEMLGDGDGWDMADIEDNPWGLVPAVVIRNRVKKGNPLGEGDCWRAFRLIDRLALTMHGEDHSNQQHTRPIPVAVNSILEGDGRPLPDEPLSVRQENPNGPPADFKLVEPSGAAREWTYKSIEKWEELLYWMVGISKVDPATVSNKGNMTRAVFTMLYARTIATSDRKRETWGQSGLCVLFQRMLLGLKNLGGVKEVAGVSPATVVSCEWPDYFGDTPADVADTTDRTVDQVSAGLLPKARAAERLAKAEGMPPDEIEEMLQELAAEAQARKAQALAAGTGSDIEDADATGTEFADVTDGMGANNVAA